MGGQQLGRSTAYNSRTEVTRALIKRKAETQGSSCSNQRLCASACLGAEALLLAL